MFLEPIGREENNDKLLTPLRPTKLLYSNYNNNLNKNLKSNLHLKLGKIEDEI